MTVSHQNTTKFCLFPADFSWGAATSSYQIEGAVAEDGRSPSVWDTFSHLPGNVVEGQTGDAGTDHYHLYQGDVRLMADMGIKAYRFSSSWSRVLPSADGVSNTRGIDFYERLVDELLGAGIQPWLTLFHWDLPQWAEDQFRGWESIDCSHAFADYAGLMAARLGDRLAGIFTINEFMCFLDKAYTANGEPFAPGKVTSKQVFNQARHHAVYGHGLAVQAIRASSPKPIPVGLAENIPNIVPLIELPEHVAAAKEALRELSGMYLTPIFEGAYHPAYLEDQGADAPVFTNDEMQVISTPIDFLGLNLYAPTYIRADPSAKRNWSQVPIDSHYPRMDMPWLHIGPQILYWCPRLVCDVWNVPAVYITENGCADVDTLDDNREVFDIGRVMYLQEHLIHLHRAVAAGYPVKGYFLWSLMDNFEWAMGYTKRFGIHYVDYETMERIPKLSARFYAAVIARNAIGE